MTHYRYQAIDSEGQPATGSVEASSAREATARLQERGYTVNRMERADARTGLLRVSKRLGWDELSLFCEQLNAVVRSGLPMPGTFKALAASVKSVRMREALEDVRRDLECGIPLHMAIERREDAFPRIFPALVKAGEASGNLPGVLRLLTQYTLQAARQRQEVIAAMTYPVILGVALLGLCIYFSETVFPMLMDLNYEGKIASGPGSSPVEWFKSAMLHYGSHRGFEIAATAVLALALVVAGRMVMDRTEAGRYRLDWLRLHVPSAGRAYYLGSLARMSGTLALLLRARVPVLDSLRLAGAASGSPVMERAMSEAATRVAAGERISDALLLSPLFSTDFLWLLATAEDRGDLEECLDNLAGRYAAEAESQDKVWVTLLNSGLVAGVGVLVTLVFLSVYGPMLTGLGNFVS